jgi:hypothetical protein
MAEGLLWNPNGLRLVWYSVEKFRCELLCLPLVGPGESRM